MPVVVRPLEPADLPAVLAMNNAAVPAVPPSDREQLEVLITTAALAVVAETTPGRPTGFLLAMDPGAAYDSENYRWFAARSDSFVYVDRIVVADGQRGSGIGRALYEAAFDRARALRRAEVTCEVNVRPANPGSLAFHARPRVRAARGAGDEGRRLPRRPARRPRAAAARRGARLGRRPGDADPMKRCATGRADAASRRTGRECPPAACACTPG